MIKIIPAHKSHEHADLIDQMFRLRAKVFAGRLDWQVQVINGWERDRFDDLEPLYVVSVDDDGRVLGTFRLLQTTGPTMLFHVFSACLPEGLVVRSPIIWESTRFCADTTLAKERGDHGLAEITGELLAALLEIGVEAGLSYVVTVIDVRMERILRRASCPIERLGDPVLIGGVPTLAIFMETTPETVARMHAKNNIREAVLPPGAIANLRTAA